MPAAAQGDVASPPAVAESRPGDDGGHHWSPRKNGGFPPRNMGDLWWFSEKMGENMRLFFFGGGMI